MGLTHHGRGPPVKGWFESQNGFVTPRLSGVEKTTADGHAGDEQFGGVPLVGRRLLSRRARGYGVLPEGCHEAYYSGGVARRFFCSKEGKGGGDTTTEERGICILSAAGGVGHCKSLITTEDGPYSVLSHGRRTTGSL